MSLRAEEKRMRRVFQMLLLSPFGAIGIMAACSSSSSSSPAGADASDDEGGSSGFLAVDAAREAYVWCAAGPPRNLSDNATCRYFTHVPCGVPGDVAVGVYGDLTDCVRFCPDPKSTTVKCYLYDGGAVRVDPLADGGFNEGGGADASGPPVPSGGVGVECETCYGGGRRPFGYRKAKPSRSPLAAKSVRSIGGYFAAMARLEAASVVSFEVLADELEHHGAPAYLTNAARASARDEQRHATLMTVTARAHGSKTSTPRIARRGVRSLTAIALENAAEGCVRETFGALVASWQAATATDPVIASLMGGIAADETRHAALSWQIARWIESRMGARDRRRVARARTRAHATLRSELAQQQAHPAADRLGLPTPSRAVHLLEAMSAALPALG